MRKKFLIRALALGLSFGALTALPNCYAETFAVSESATVDLNFDVSQGVEKTLSYDGRAVTFVAYENIFLRRQTRQRRAKVERVHSRRISARRND